MLHMFRLSNMTSFQQALWSHFPSAMSIVKWVLPLFVWGNSLCVQVPRRGCFLVVINYVFKTFYPDTDWQQYAILRAWLMTPWLSKLFKKSANPDLQSWRSFTFPDMRKSIISILWKQFYPEYRTVMSNGMKNDNCISINVMIRKIPSW